MALGSALEGPKRPPHLTNVNFARTRESRACRASVQTNKTVVNELLCQLIGELMSSSDFTASRDSVDVRPLS